MRRLTVAAALILVSLAGCGGSEEKPNADLAELKAGDCIAKDIKDENDRAPDVDSVVECSEPHVYEIVELVDIPEEALTGTTDKEKLANRKDLATWPTGEEGEELSSQKGAYLEFTDGACEDEYVGLSGLEDVSVNGVDAKDAIVAPALEAGFHQWINVTPGDLWLDGDRQLMCSFRFGDVEPGSYEESPPARSVASKTDKALFTTMGSSDLPAELRSCDETNHCGRQHGSETLFHFDAQSVLDEKLVNGIDPKKPTDQQLKQLTGICEDAVPSLLGDDFGARDISIEAFVGEPWEDDYYKTVGCEIVPTDTTKDFAPGSLIFTDLEAIEFVDAK
ncbi:MAG: hypothetical protein WAL70_14660 [Aeromicrobium sp.]